MYNYRVHFCNFVDRHDLKVELGVGRNMDLVLAKPFYDVWRRWNDQYSNYDVYASDDLKAVERVLEGMTKLGEFAHVFLSLYNLDFGTSFLLRKKGTNPVLV